ncbi:hypothetical protein [Shewanella sp.]|uniref:hypothetical protein n=1 Tax=Shewanella sp. TaxID=50422 RepID=UPI003F2F1BD3
MKAAESKIVLDPSLHPMARCLYLALRHCASYSTGIVKISYSTMVDLIKYTPPVKSKLAPITPTIKQIRVWLEALVERGLLLKMADGNAAKGTLSEWFLPEFKKGTVEGHSETQSHQGFQQDEGHIRRAQEGHKKGTVEGHGETLTHQGFQQDEGHNKNREEGHISLKIKDKDKSNIYIAPTCENFQTDGWDLTTEQSPSTPAPQTGELVDDEPFPAPINPITTKVPISPTGALTAEQLILDSELRATARIVGLTMPVDQLDLVFIDFQSNKHNRYKCQGRADWIADWRSWCAKSKLFHARSQGNATTNQHSGFSKNNSQLSDSAKVYAFVRAEAEKYASGDER